MRETVGDLDILVVGQRTVARSPTVSSRYPDVAETTVAGRRRAQRASCGAACRSTCASCRPTSYGAALAYFTGSKAHNIALRRVGQEHGLKINEYGVFRGSQRDRRRDRGVGVRGPSACPSFRRSCARTAARSRPRATGGCPRSSSYADLSGDLHAHTNATDGRDTLEEMVAAAQALGFEYLAITEHSRRQAMSHGLDPRRGSCGRSREIDRLNARLEGIRVLHGHRGRHPRRRHARPAGRGARRLDVVVAAVHSQFDLPRARQTERILRALDNPQVTILAHPTGRLIGEREPYDVDMLQVIRKAQGDGCASRSSMRIPSGST